MSLYKSGQ